MEQSRANTHTNHYELTRRLSSASCCMIAQVTCPCFIVDGPLWMTANNVTVMWLSYDKTFVQHLRSWLVANFKMGFERFEYSRPHDRLSKPWSSVSSSEMSWSMMGWQPRFSSGNGVICLHGLYVCVLAFQRRTFTYTCTHTHTLIILCKYPLLSPPSPPSHPLAASIQWNWRNDAVTTRWGLHVRPMPPFQQLTVHVIGTTRCKV